MRPTSHKPRLKVWTRKTGLNWTHSGFTAANGSGSDGTGLLVPAQDFGHAAVGDPQLAGNDAGPDPVVGQLHDLVSDVVRKRPAINEDPSKLVDPALAQRSWYCWHTEPRTEK